MIVYAGIDEAGYGPMFGPLCVGCTVFQIDEMTANNTWPDLWQVLKRSVCRRPGDSRGRIAVDDSKNLKGSASRTRHPLADLERGVLAFIQTTDDQTNSKLHTDAELFRALHACECSQPWYESQTELPVAGDAALGRITTSRLQRTLDEAGVRCVSMRCAAVDVGSFNRGINTFGNKAGVNLHHALKHAEHVRLSHPKTRLEIVIDRQGGRTHYRRQLQDTWPDARLRIEDETESTSRYRLDLGEQIMTITFARQAEAKHFPVALASMTAKYVRELLMLRLNTYFRQQMPDLKPTAGYVQDGRRFLKDIEPVIRRLDLPRLELIRQR